jgi:anti-sigma factor RsiW
MNSNLNTRDGSLCRPHLAEDEMQLFEYLDGHTSAQQAARARAHLANCSQCQNLQQQWQQLDSQVAIGLTSPALSAGFAARVLANIDSQPLPSLVTPDRRPDRVQLETEWESLWAHHRNNFVRSVPPALLDYVGYAVGLAFGGYFLFCLLNRFLKTLLNAPAEPSSQFLLPVACGLGLLALVLAISCATKNRLWRWLAEL